MPFVDGKRISNEEWRRLRGWKPVGWKEIAGWHDMEGTEVEAEAPAPVSDEPVRVKRQGRKKKEAEAALKAVTGMDIEVDEVADLPTPEGEPLED